MRLFISPQRDYYVAHISANETKQWANREGARWPCSTLVGHRLMVAVDTNGLCDLIVDGGYSEEIDGCELNMCVGDFLKKHRKFGRVCHMWPVWADLNKNGIKETP